MTPSSCTEVPAHRAAAIGVMLCAFLAGCGARDATSTQTAARVNKEEITVHQIGAQLSQQPVKPEQVAQAERQILERLISRELAVQKADDLKLDRDPKVIQAVESARKEIIARAYADKIGEGASRPSEADIKKYYEAHPALFAERKVYQLQEFVVEADAGQMESLKASMPTLKSGDEIAAHLKANNLKFTSNAVVRAAEQVPLPMLAALARLEAGQALLGGTPGAAQLIVLRDSRSQPVEEARAARAIEQFLFNEQKRKLLADDLQALRTAAKIEYHGRFATTAPAATADANRAASAAEVAASAAAMPQGKPVNEAPKASAAASGAAAASGIDASTVNKGLGLK